MSHLCEPQMSPAHWGGQMANWGPTVWPGQASCAAALRPQPTPLRAWPQEELVPLLPQPGPVFPPSCGPISSAAQVQRGPPYPSPHCPERPEDPQKAPKDATTGAGTVPQAVKPQPVMPAPFSTVLGSVFPSLSLCLSDKQSILKKKICKNFLANSNSATT